MQFKTSTKISLKFTLFATIVILIFSVVIIILFFEIRYSKQRTNLHMDISYTPPQLLELARTSHFFKSPDREDTTLSVGQKMVSGSRHLLRTPSVPSLNTAYVVKVRENVVPMVMTLPLQEFSAEQGYHTLDFLSYLSRGKVHIVYHDYKYFIYGIDKDTVKLLDITGFMYIQAELIQLLIFGDVCSIVFVYLVSLYFVKSSLKQLKKLTSFAQHLDFETLSTAIHLKGHKYDEIKVIAEALNTSLEKIHTQIIALKDFISNASHELKTPLMMINSEIDIALKTKQYEEHLLNIKKHIKRQSDLLDVLSLITCLENEKNLQKQNLSLQDIVKEVVKEIKQQYPKRKISVEIGKEKMIVANAFLVEIIIKNLIENACKYAGSQARITIKGTATTLSVSDTGKGIAPEYHEKIFERFRQLDKVEAEEHSFGLGLYLVKKIVQLHGRTISLESEVGKGSTFIIHW